MISAVAQRYNIHPQTLRLYEREGLLRPSRTDGNTRLYSDEDLERLETILTLTRELGVNLAGVEIILNLRERMAQMQHEVNEFMAIEEYSHVIHIVSNVRGELAEGRTTFDAIRACFPGGTITGAPKVRSMEIIEELEPSRRGIYTGSIGWIGYDGDAELNIAIRTIVMKDGVAYAQAGAGIVADSVPELEYAESLRKAQAALEAMEAIQNSKFEIQKNGEGEEEEASPGTSGAIGASEHSLPAS